MAGRVLKIPKTVLSGKSLTSVDCPHFPESISGPDSWDMIGGLSANSIQETAVIPGQRILRLIAVGANGQSDGRHALGIRFRGLAAGGIYRAVAWIKELKSAQNRRSPRKIRRSQVCET